MVSLLISLRVSHSGIGSGDHVFARRRRRDVGLAGRPRHGHAQTHTRHHRDLQIALIVVHLTKEGEADAVFDGAM